MQDSFDQQLELLVDALCQRRCLLILDDLESVFLGGERAGLYRAGYEGYGQLISYTGQHRHQSCLILTGRELPLDLARLERDTPLVRTFQLNGLTAMGAQAILDEQGLKLQDNDYVMISTRYSGNPLALRLAATMIRDLFAGDIAAFLHSKTPIFDDIRDVLDQQFARLSVLEHELLIWLAIELEPTTIAALQGNFVEREPRPMVLEALRSLQRRSLLEQHDQGFTLQNVVMEYTTELLVTRVVRELENDQLDLFARHALVKAKAPEYVRQSQLRLIVAPIAERLTARLGRANLLAKLRALLDVLRGRPELASSFAAGNVLNLLIFLGADLRGLDPSRLAA
ncbi:MAG: hypothetical protein IPP13_12020 [Kouleothrix sp.]|jgi:hypothetical protein|nr:hypothetical protein [Kouleothrix sp.]